MEVIGISKSEFDRKLKNLEDRLMDMSDSFTIEDFRKNLRIIEGGREYRIQTLNGVDLCPRCNVIGIYSKPARYQPGYIILCESCGYQPYAY